jgi:hypothetical protein
VRLSDWLGRLRSFSRVSVVQLEPKEAADLLEQVTRLRHAMKLEVVERSAEGTRCRWCGTESPVSEREHHMHREGCVLE